MNIKRAFFAVAAVIALSLLVNACRKNSNSDHRTTPITFSIPEGFPEPVYQFQENPLTQEGFELGRRLFHDNKLSKFSDVTCNSCHQQIAGYTTFDHDLGHGTNNQHTTRNVPVIFNMVWQQEFGWAGGTMKLDDQIMACLVAPEKMAETPQGVIAKLDTSESYRQMFTEAFGDANISENRISRALAQFVAMLVSSNSKYDSVKRGQSQFSTNEAVGYDLFKTNCASCHTEPLFTDFSYRNIGLPHRDFHEDAGRILVTGNSSDSLKFKVPSLRNIGITSYYAHDGRFAGISEILKHYSDEVVPGANVDPLVANKIPLTNLERFYIQEFLLTLTDSSLVKDPRFSN